MKEERRDYNQSLNCAWSTCFYYCQQPLAVMSPNGPENSKRGSEKQIRTNCTTKQNSTYYSSDPTPFHSWLSGALFRLEQSGAHLDKYITYMFLWGKVIHLATLEILELFWRLPSLRRGPAKGIQSVAQHPTLSTHSPTYSTCLSEACMVRVIREYSEIRAVRLHIKSSPK